MNAVGVALVWSAAQVTLLLAVGGVGYLALRRRGPAWGSLVALALLSIAALLPVLALAPWPSWYRWDFLGDGSRQPKSALAENVADAAGASASTAPSNKAAQSPNGGADSSKLSTWTTAVWDSFREGLRVERRPADSSWKWTAVLAGLLLAGGALGVIRLLIGLIAVARLRRRMRPIGDEDLAELLKTARSRFGCRQAIALCESPDVDSPATIGWRRPVILLPTSWRQWNSLQRRAVIAHEVAHVARGDFAAWLVAQACTAVHFYHPLVHWLSRQLRLEQELAADACGALASGGGGPYLEVLARMTLEQNNRRAGWAARPFLPPPGTLLRRIDMLRSSRPRAVLGFSIRQRLMICSALVVLGLVVAGVRGPADSARAADNEKSIKQGIAFLAANTVGESDQGPTDLAGYIPADAAVVVVAHPHDILRAEPVKALATASPKTLERLEKSLTLNPADLETVIFADTDLSGRPALLILRADKPHDWTKFAATVVDDPLAIKSTEPPLANKEYFRSHKASGDHEPAYFLPDDRTIVVAEEAEIRSMLAAGAAELKADDWRRKLTGSVSVELNTQEIRRQIEPRIKNLPQPEQSVFAMAGPVWQDTERMLLLGEISSSKLSLRAEAICPSAKAAERVDRTLQALETMAENALSATSQQPGGIPKQVRPLADMARQLLTDIRFSRRDNVVVAESASTGSGLDALAKTLPLLDRAREAASRARDMNSMRQLALAMHMYNDVHGHFPPAIALDPSGKPHSWRIELLPYLEQQQLYKQYKMDEPWDSEANKKVLAQMPAIFRSPTEEDPNSTNTAYFVLTGKQTMFTDHQGIKIAEITGGTSQTIMIVETKKDTPWTAPDDIPVEADKRLPKLGGIFDSGFYAAWADGSVRLVTNEEISKKGDKWLRAQIDPRSGNKMEVSVEQGGFTPVPTSPVPIEPKPLTPPAKP